MSRREWICCGALAVALAAAAALGVRLYDPGLEIQNAIHTYKAAGSWTKLLHGSLANTFKRAREGKVVRGVTNHTHSVTC